MRVLMVGTGAVGQVFGLVLRRAGVELAFYARPGSVARLHRALVQGGLPLFEISRSRGRTPIAHRLDGYQVVTDVAGSRRFKPDQIWFATPSPVYHSAWFQDFLHEVPSERVVCFAPEGGRAEFRSDSGAEDRLVFGGITFMAWQGDLDGGGGRPEGVNFWLPPLVEIPLMGREGACREVADLLEAGGFRSAAKPAAFQASQAAATAVLSAFVAGLELSAWSLKAFLRGHWLRIAAAGAREAALTQLQNTGPLTRMLLGGLLSSAGLSLVTLLLPRLFPFDVERYLRFHYRKTRDQTLDLLDLFVRDGSRRGLSVETIQLLLQGLRDAG